MMGLLSTRWAVCALVATLALVALLPTGLADSTAVDGIAERNEDGAASQDALARAQTAEVRRNAAPMSSQHHPERAAHHAKRNVAAAANVHEHRDLLRPLGEEGTRRFRARRATQAQHDAQQRLNDQAQTSAKQNTQWQQATQKALKNNDAPPNFDDVSGSGTSSSSSSSPSSSSKSSKSSSNAGSHKYAKQGGSSKSKSSKSKSSKSKSSSSSSSSSSSGGGSSSSGQQFTGQGTYFSPSLGSCGQSNTDSDNIVAISQSLYDSFGSNNPNSNPACGKKINVQYQGKSVDVTVADRCTGCSQYDLDFTPSAFSKLADQSVGRLSGIQWSWADGAPK